MRRLTNFFTRVALKYLPDAFLFSLILTLVVLVFGILIENHSPLQMIKFWGDGFWNLMSFSMQMTLILVSGYCLAQANFIKKCLAKLASKAKTNTQAIVLVTIISCLSCYINWGFGLIVSALFAVELAKNLKKINFSLLIASSFSGFLVWHGGLSGSIPLKLTSPAANIQAILASDGISLSETIFSFYNLLLVLLTVLTLVFVNYLASKNEEDIIEISLQDTNSEFQENKGNSFSAKIENSSIFSMIFAFMGLIYMSLFFKAGGSLGLNQMIFIFLILSLCFHLTPARFIYYFKDSVKQSSSIILLFPFYAGIMGMMSSSGLAQSLSEFFISISNKETFYLTTYLSAGIVNFFVPSGGGQWAIQGPIILPAAKALGVDLGRASMAIAWGDAWTNMVQPFWAIPLLSIAGLELKNIMGHLVSVFLIIGALTCSFFLILGFV